VWSLYLGLMMSVSLVIGSTTALDAVTTAIKDRWRPEMLASALPWLALWAWHWWMRSRHRPEVMAALAPSVGSVFGIGMTAVGSGVALGSLLTEAANRLTDTATAGRDWWLTPLESTVWAAGGAAIWWWHRHATRLQPSTLEAIRTVGVGVAGGAATALAGAGAIVSVPLLAVIGPGRTMAALIDPLPAALAGAAVGGIVWAIHHREARRRSIVENARLVLATLGLIGATAGLGVVVNSVLSLFSTPLAETGRAGLLAGGLAAMTVGVPTWWVAWRPTREAAPLTGTLARRIHLTVISVIGAVTALVSLIVVAFRLLELWLEGGGGFIDRIRAPLGVLVATALVAAYHYPRWRRERAAAAPSATHHGEVILVTTPGAAGLAKIVHEATGAHVRSMTRSDLPGAGPDAAHVLAALEGIDGGRVLVVTGPGERVEVIPLA
jgi:hypothetical protein